MIGCLRKLEHFFFNFNTSLAPTHVHRFSFNFDKDSQVSMTEESDKIFWQTLDQSTEGN